MTDQLISFETAKLAKNKGFNIEINTAYDEDGIIGLKSHAYSIGGVFYKTNDLSKKQPNEIRSLTNLMLIPAPTQSLLQKWLREVHDIHVNVSSRYNPKKLEDKVFYSYELSTKENFYGGIDDNLDTWLGWNQENNIPILMYRTYNMYEEALEQGLIDALNLL